MNAKSIMSMLPLIGVVLLLWNLGLIVFGFIKYQKTYAGHPVMKKAYSSYVTDLGMAAKYDVDENGMNVTSLSTTPVAKYNKSNTIGPLNMIPRHGVGKNIRNIVSSSEKKAAKVTAGKMVGKMSNTKYTTHVLSKEVISGRRDKYVIYACNGGCGGFGDRLKGMVNAYLWALVTNRTLKFMLKHPCPDYLKGLLLPNRIKWNKNVPSTNSAFVLHLIDNGQFRSTISQGNLEIKYPSDVVVLRSNVPYWIAFANVPHYRNILQKHGFSDFSGRGIFKKAFYDLFTWSPDFKAELARLRNAERPLICAQIRLGGNSKSMTFDPPRRNMTSVMKQFEALANTKRTFPASRIFITTDSEEVRELGYKIFGSSYLETPGEITHTDRSRSDRACAGMKKVVLDFYILTECDNLQVSWSGYGILASYLNRNQKNVSMTWKGGVIYGEILENFI